MKLKGKTMDKKQLIKAQIDRYNSCTQIEKMIYNRRRDVAFERLLKYLNIAITSLNDVHLGQLIHVFNLNTMDILIFEIYFKNGKQQTWACDEHCTKIVSTIN